MSSPTQRSLALLKKEGYVPWITEHFNSFGNVRVDLYGFIDIVALKSGEVGILGVQTTAASGLSARVHKILGIPAYHLWLECGNRIWVMGWRKEKKTNHWKSRTIEIKLDNKKDPIQELIMV